MRHQYVDRRSGSIVDEPLFQDKMIKFIYSRAREKAPVIFKALTSARFSSLLGYINFDAPLLSRVSGTRNLASSLNLDLSECLEEPASLDTPRKLFERQIRYWEVRPLDEEADVVSPADAKVLVGSLRKNSVLFIKDKFFLYEELLGRQRQNWLKTFHDGDFAILRLTPDKYHYNHCPVSGVVVDIYSLDGCFNSCNPDAVISIASPYSKNRRVVTIIDTDVAGGSQVGPVAMVEVVAMMIGDIRQCYSDSAYDDPRPVRVGMFLKKGQPKSLFRPGSSTDVLIFASRRIRFAEDIIHNMFRSGCSRFNHGFGQPLMETDLDVRSALAHKRKDS